MCGICGFNWRDEELLADMMSKLVHRGPDDSGFYTDDDISLGHQRLSIIDLTERGKQPMFDESKRYAITYNGEVYNYIELREGLIKKGYSFKLDTDTEVVLKMYIEYGLKALDYLNGMFAFAIYDKKVKKLFLARVRFGIKPLYYYVDDDSFIFSSEIAPILIHKIKVKLNDSLIYDFLLYSHSFIIGDVRDYTSIYDATKNIDIVYHAAALKQVPNSENHPFEAVKTNVIGAENVRCTSIENGVEVVVAVSTDNAVKPINVMGMGMAKAIQERLMFNPNNGRWDTKK